MLFFINSIKAFSYGITPTRSGLLDPVERVDTFSSNNATSNLKKDDINTELLNYFDEVSQLN